jgi:hypothetical protein
LTTDGKHEANASGLMGPGYEKLRAIAKAMGFAVEE